MIVRPLQCGLQIKFKMVKKISICEQRSHLITGGDSEQCRTTQRVFLDPCALEITSIIIIIVIIKNDSTLFRKFSTGNGGMFNHLKRRPFHVL